MTFQVMRKTDKWISPFSRHVDEEARKQQQESQYNLDQQQMNDPEWIIWMVIAGVSED